MNIRNLFLACVLCSASLSVSAQVDTEFWFAPPEVSSGHGDLPLLIRISTLDKEASVVITQPARGNIVLATVTVAPNSTRTVDVSAHRNTLETFSTATVMKTGIKITSTAPVTAYYEVGSQWNSDIFPLKGKNALGNNFMIPGQDFYSNSNGYSPTPGSSFDIVATQNNTVVKIRPSKPLVGHTGDTLIVIKLNKGETYSLRKVGLAAMDNPFGTEVTSNKPIAITIKDDSVVNGGCRDLLGDQIVPIEVAGTEYVVQKGFLDGAEHLFIMAIDNGTDISFNGASPSATLGKGEIFRHVMSANSIYLVASKPVYVLHVTGFGCEMGMALLPSITCKGSQQIGFSRTTSEFFGLNVLVRKEGIGHFTINGSQNLIPASSFAPVPGSGDRYYTAQLSFTTGQINVGQGSLIANELNSFQVGVINGNATTTCRYGYFSSFSTLFVGDDFSICEGETALLDAGPGKESYVWSTGETTQQTTVSEPGLYWVKVIKEECELVDSILLEVKAGHLDLGSDVSLCSGDKTKIDGKENFSWAWSDGSAAQFLETSVPGKYWIDVVDYNGCRASDTIYVIEQLPPVLNLGDDIIKCANEDVTLNIPHPGALYLWSDGKNTASNTITEAGEYWAQVIVNGCDAVDSLAVINLPVPKQDSIFGSPSVCPFSKSISYHTDDLEDSNYDWHVTGGSMSNEAGAVIEVNWDGSREDASVNLVVRNGHGCQSDSLFYAVRINPELIVEIPDGPDSICFNNAHEVIYTTPVTNGSFYQWEISGGEILDGQGTEKITVAWEKGDNTLQIHESATTDIVCTGDSPELQVTVFEDPLSLAIEYVSLDTANESSIILEWTPSGKLSNPAALYQRVTGDSTWVLNSGFSEHDHVVVTQAMNTAQISYEYLMETDNFCHEKVSTAIHNTILLAGDADSEMSEIILTWTHYMGWPEGVERYEVWRQLDNSAGLRLLEAVPGQTSVFTGKIAGDGFDHRYVIRAVQRNGTHSSWSNSVEFEFEHPIVVPNIFTPNNDDKNQYFTIPKIELYTNSVLTIVDRWGKLVFQSHGYQNNWNGNGLSSGLYYYTLTLNREKKFYKGIVSIVR